MEEKGKIVEPWDVRRIMHALRPHAAHTRCQETTPSRVKVYFHGLRIISHFKIN